MDAISISAGDELVFELCHVQCERAMDDGGTGISLEEV